MHVRLGYKKVPKPERFGFLFVMFVICCILDDQACHVAHKSSRLWLTRLLHRNPVFSTSYGLDGVQIVLGVGVSWRPCFVLSWASKEVTETTNFVHCVQNHYDESNKQMSVISSIRGVLSCVDNLRKQHVATTLFYTIGFQFENVCTLLRN